MKKKKLSLRKLKEWATSAVVGTVISLSYVSKIDEHFEYSFSSPTALIKSIQSDHGDLFKSGKYTLTLSDEMVEQDDEDFSKVSYAYALSVTIDKESRGAVHTFGAHEKLMESISEFEFVVQKPSNKGVTSIWIEMPESKEDLANLAHILNNFSSSYAFPDGSGTFNEANMRAGKGPFHISQVDNTIS